MGGRLHVSASSLLFCNDPATTEIYTLSLHDALPIFTRSCSAARGWPSTPSTRSFGHTNLRHRSQPNERRSEEHTSELQSRQYLVCRLLLEKKNRSNRTRDQVR